jgi:putative colanic acid biosynthesis acetyltransferase WcaF
MNGFRRFLLVCFGAKLARNVSVHNTARIHCPWNLEMKEKSSLGEYSWIYTLGRISVGECSCVGQHVFLLTGTHDYTDTTFPLVIKPIEIGYGCWLAVGARILPGVTIGDYAVIGAGSVVAKNVEPWAVVAGNPARFIKKRILKETA